MLSTGERFNPQKCCYNESFNKNNNNLVELGAGYGSKIINIANHFNKKKYNINYYAGEFSLKGRQIIKKVSTDSNLNIDIFKFNLFVLVNLENNFFGLSKIYCKISIS